MIDTYRVTNGGYLNGPISNQSSGSTPFGFRFTHRSLAVVSEAGANALSSYKVNDNGQLDLVTGSLANGQAGVCWVVVTEDGHFAYTINAASGTISSYAVAHDGTLSLLNAVAAATGAGTVPTDPALAQGNDLLYVRVGGDGRILGYRVERDGSLTQVSAAAGVPSGAQGLAAR